MDLGTNGGGRSFRTYQYHQYRASLTDLDPFIRDRDPSISVADPGLFFTDPGIFSQSGSESRGGKTHFFKGNNKILGEIFVFNPKSGYFCFQPKK